VLRAIKAPSSRKKLTISGFVVIENVDTGDALTTADGDAAVGVGFSGVELLAAVAAGVHEIARSSVERTRLFIMRRSSPIELGLSADFGRDKSYALRRPQLLSASMRSTAWSTATGPIVT
jgi:hypothetical protein